MIAARLSSSVRSMLSAFVWFILLSHAGSAATMAQSPPSCGTVTDTNPHVPGNPDDWGTFTPPLLGASYIDPEFGCIIRRLTDGATEYPADPNCASTGVCVMQHPYASVSPFNMDSSRVLLDKDGFMQIRDLRGNRILEDLNRFGILPTSDPVWSRTNPNVLYFMDTQPGPCSPYCRQVLLKSLDITDISNPQTTLLHDFSSSAYPYFDKVSIGQGEGDISWDGTRLPLIACGASVGLPSSDAGPNQGSPTPVGSHYLNVDEDPHDGDATIISFPGGGEKEVFPIAVQLNDTDVITSVKVRWVAKKGSGADWQGKAGLVIGAQEYYGPTRSLEADYTLYEEIFLVNPATGLPWTVVDVRNAKLIYQQVTITTELPVARLTQIVMAVTTADTQYCSPRDPGRASWVFIHTIGPPGSSTVPVSITDQDVDNSDLLPSNQMVVERVPPSNQIDLYNQQGQLVTSPLLDYHSHWDRGKDIDGTDMFVEGDGAADPGVSNCPFTQAGDWKVKFRLPSGPEQCLMTLDWKLVDHVSCNNVGQNWCLISTYPNSTEVNPSQVWPAYADELFQLKLDGTTAVRLAHTRSSGWDYTRESRAAVSPNGKYILFDSDMNDTCIPSCSRQPDVYLLVLPGATQDLVELPNSDAGPNQGSPFPGALHYADVDDDPHDGDTTLISFSGGGQKEVFTTADQLLDTDIITSVKVRWVAKKGSGTWQAKAGLVIGAQEFYGPTRNLLLPYTQYEETFLNNPATNGGWSVQDVRNAKLIYQQVRITTQLPRARLTEIVLVVTVER